LRFVPRSEQFRFALGPVQAAIEERESVPARLRPFDQMSA
jgi:hypothetical protein